MDACPNVKRSETGGVDACLPAGRVDGGEKSEVGSRKSEVGGRLPECWAKGDRWSGRKFNALIF